MRDGGTSSGTRVPGAASLRVGGIDYLNALPLTAYLPRDGIPPLEIHDRYPGQLADGLRSGDLDVALAPVVEYPLRRDYRVIPQACISSYGEVRSVRLYHRTALNEVRRVGLDSRSRSSALLTRLLFADLWKASPEYVPMALGGRIPGGASGTRRSAGVPWLTREPEGPGRLDAVLVIGDAALSIEAGPPWDFVDLGTEWSRWTGLPFVYAFWICRRGVADQVGLVERFLQGKAVGLARIDDIVRRAARPPGLDAAACLRYLSSCIGYDLDALRVEGCLEFFARLKRASLLELAPRSLQFAGGGRSPGLDPLSPTGSSGKKS